MPGCLRTSAWTLANVDESAAPGQGDAVPGACRHRLLAKHLVKP